MPSISQNKRAHFDYQILETFEAGLMLTGAEAKSAKTGQMGLKSAYATLKFNAQTKRPELFLINAHIPPYQKANAAKDYDPERSRKLLLHQREIQSLIGKLKQKGLTLLPLKAYTKRGKIKVELGLGKGKRKIDKREVIKQRELSRELRQTVKMN
ncbi:MAG: SsrA-binding protein SmpB [bacterium]